MSLGTFHGGKTSSEWIIDVKSIGHPCYNIRRLVLASSLREGGLPLFFGTWRFRLMATADRPRSSSLDPATRRQLDELDLLMQRMLALPVNPREDPATPLPQQPADPGVADNPSPPPEE